MPKLIVKKKAEIIKECDLKTSQASYTIGTEAQNDLSIDDRLVSITHARIERSGNRFFIRDLKSAFGTFVNGERVEDVAELLDGSDIRLGDHTIVFDNPLEKICMSLLEEDDSGHSLDFDSQPESAPDRQQERLDEFEGKMRRESRTLLRQARAEKTDTLPYQLLSIHGPYKGKRFQLLRDETKIGRDENLNDIVLDKNKSGGPDQSISRRHAMVMFRDGSFFVTDKRSKTRTYVNREVVPADGEIEIFPDDEIEIVSDQHSTIFRLVDDGAIDFRPPKKAGVWWVRYQPKLASALIGLALAGGGYLMATGFQERTLLTQKPDPLSLELIHWSTDKSLTFQSGQAGSAEESRLFSLVPAVSDFDGDGVIDIATTNITRKPILISGATKLPIWLIDTLPASEKSPIIAADVNQNNLNDVIYVTEDGRVVAIDGKHGAEIWVSPFFDQQLIGPPVVGDFDGDKLNDVAIADVTGMIHVGYNRVLSMEWSTIATGIPIHAPLTCADLDQDGDSELICGSERGIIFIIDGVARNIVGAIDINEALNRALGTFYEDNQIRYPIGVAYLNDDLRLDLIASTVQGRIIAIDGASRERLWHDVLTNELTLNTDRSFPFAVGDLDGNGRVDVVAAADGGEVRAYLGSGQDQQAIFFWAAAPETPSAINGFMVGDINKDTSVDVVFNNADGVLWVLDGKTGTNLTNMEQGSPVQTSMPLAADLQDDGLLDIFSITRTGIVFQYKTNSRVPRSAIIWGQQYGESGNTLNAAYQLPETLAADASLLIGLLMFLGGGGVTFILKKRKRN